MEAKEAGGRAKCESRLKERVRSELIGIGLLLLGVFLFMALFSYSPLDQSFNSTLSRVENSAGVAGSYTADLLIQNLFGWASFLLPIALTIYAVRYMIFRPVQHPGWVALGYAALILTGSALMDLLFVNFMVDGRSIPAGGGGGYAIAIEFVKLLNRPGAYLFLFTGFLAALMFTVNFSLFAFGERIRLLLLERFRGVRERWIMRREQRAKRKSRGGEAPAFQEPKIVPKIVKEEEKPAAKPKPALQETFEFVREVDGFHLPPLDIFELSESDGTAPDQESLLMTSKILLKKLQDFGVQGEVVTVHPGPVVTMFEFKPAPGVKINKIVNLADDLALALRALSIRIVAPIPGRDTVGVEIPNANRQLVTLGDVLDSAEFRQTDSKLAMSLGKDISGNPVVADLAKMPHLLIAGATGSGKSVGVHSMLATLLSRATPKEVRLLIVDPKMLELSVYDDIPHLLLPVVTEAKKAAVALRWAVAEMERRYRLMAEEGVRNLSSHNRKVEKMLADGAPPGADGQGPEYLPFIVVVIDELADLMMVSGKEVEDSIARLAQMARAAGIHLIVATQRPSVDVITGMIKANFPARIAFQVASKVDSRTILDTGGAEALLGGGDMLFLPPGTSKLMRVHGSYVSEREIERLVKFLRAQGTPEYREEILHDPGEDGNLGMDPDLDELYDEAVQFICESRQASVSMIQRRFKIGYNRAARLIEMMEQEGVVGPSRGAKPREVLAGRL